MRLLSLSTAPKILGLQGRTWASLLCLSALLCIAPVLLVKSKPAWGTTQGSAGISSACALLEHELLSKAAEEGRLEQLLKDLLQTQTDGADGGRKWREDLQSTMHNVLAHASMAIHPLSGPQMGVESVAPLVEHPGGIPDKQPSDNAAIKGLASDSSHEQGREVEEHVCGTWQKNYAESHRAIRHGIVPAPRRQYAIFTCGPTGLGDQLLGLANTFLFALLSRRAFLVHWDGILSVFEPNAVDWRISHGEDADLADYWNLAANHSWWGRHRSRPRSWIGTNSEQLSDRLLMVDLQDHHFQSWKVVLQETAGLAIVGVKMNHGRISQLFREPALQSLVDSIGLLPHFAFGCILRFLLRVTAAVQSLAQETAVELEKEGTLSVCVHSRMGDKSFHYKQGGNNYNQIVRRTLPLLHCAENVTKFWAPPHANVRWFFMTENAALRSTVSAMYPGRVLVSPIAAAKHSAKGGPDALLSSAVDWHLFSKCHFFIFKDSGLSKTAALYALRPSRMYVFRRTLFDDDVESDADLKDHCVPWLPTSPLYELRWSGL